jgi:hypothetical protein
MRNRYCVGLVALMLLLSALGPPALTPAAMARKPTAKKKVQATKDQAVVKLPGFVKACASYKNGKYLDAIKELEYIDTHGGCCQWTHYYLGLCYQGLNQVGLAYRHFGWVLSYGRDANLRRYSQYGQDTLSYYAANRTYGGQGGIAGAVAQSGGGGGRSFG